MTSVAAMEKFGSSALGNSDADIEWAAWGAAAGKATVLNV